MVNLAAHFLSLTQFFWKDYIAIIYLLRTFKVKSEVKCSYNITHIRIIEKFLIRK